MSSKRAMLANLFEKTRTFSLLERLSVPSLVVINFHRLYREKVDTEFDEGVFGHSEAQFLEQMQWLKSNFHLISESELIDSINSKATLKNRTALITFDDGYLDNYEIAYPILKQLAIPATFFVSCNHVGGGMLPWWDQIAYIVKRSSQQTPINFEGIIIPPNADIDRINESVNEILALFKTLTAKQIDESLTQLSTATKVPLPEGEKGDSQFMTWQQIKEVSNNGISIGSHSMNHDVLSQLSVEKQQWEIEESKRLIESKIARPVHSLAYPVGGKTAFNQDTIRLTRSAGYKLGFSFLQGSYNSFEFDEYQIHRIKLDQSRALFKAQMLMPKIFLKAI